MKTVHDAKVVSIGDLEPGWYVSVIRITNHTPYFEPVSYVGPLATEGEAHGVEDALARDLQDSFASTSTFVVHEDRTRTVSERSMQRIAIDIDKQATAARMRPRRRRRR